MTDLDLTLLPLYRLDQQELPSLPGLLGMTAPRKVARGRETDRLIVYLTLNGNTSFSTAEYLQYTTKTASRFFETPGALTSAMRAGAQALNDRLLERNLNSTSKGQYVIGWLTLAALRGSHCTLLQAGPSHAFWMGQEDIRHMHDPVLSGKGLGLGQAVNFYLSQSELHPGDRMLFSGNPSPGWEAALKDGIRLSSLEAARRRLFALAHGNINAVLIHVSEGRGELNILHPAPSEKNASAPQTRAESLPLSSQPDPGPEPDFPETSNAPASAYAIPVQEKTEADFPASIPRLRTPPSEEYPPLMEMDESIMSETEAETPPPREPSETTRQVAKKLVGGMQAWRRMSESLAGSIGRFLPNLLPGSASSSQSPLSNISMFFIAIAVPLLVVTLASVIYFRFGHSYQYDNFITQAETARTQAVSASDPARQRDGWQSVLFYVKRAEEYRTTPESQSMRLEAQANLDELLGIQRLDFFPAFSGGTGVQISRLAANDTDLYLLDAEQGRILYASQTGGRGFEINTSFRCDPGTYGGYQVGTLVDILILPRLNSMNATVLGTDTGGNLLYCAPGQVPQAIPLPPPDTGWGRVAAFTFDSGNLYVLDSESRALWVYIGKEASFLDRPYFYFGGQIPEINNAIDLVVDGDKLYLLHADGQLTVCSYSRMETVPTQCESPTEFTGLFPAYKDVNLFEQAHITQMQLTPAPNSTLALLDVDTHGVLRLSPHSLELQNQIRPAIDSESPMPSGPASAMTFSTNHALFIAVGDRVYFTMNAH